MDFIRTAIKRPVFISSIVMLILIVGFTSFKKLGVDLFPDVTFPVISIQTIYPGASPNDIEEQVSKPIEEEIGSLSGLKRLYSNNLESVSLIIAEFELGTDIKNSEQQIRERINTVKGKLPSEIKDPIVRRMDPADQPIVRLAVVSPIEKTELYTVIENVVKNKLERIPGVGLVEILGGQKREIQVEINKDKLQKLELSVLQVASRVGATSKNVPVGNIADSQHERSLRSVGDFRSIDDLANVNVNFIGSDKAILLKDVATIRSGAESESTRATFNGNPSLVVDVYRQRGANTVEVGTSIINSIDDINKLLKLKGHDAQVSIVRDGAWPIRANVMDVQESIIIGIILCVVVVFVFLGSFKSTVITGLAIPNSLLGACIIMYVLGFTINIMTLLALSLAIGLLVDDAIVVRENIFRHVEMGEEPAEAAEKGTKEVALAVIATTLVVIAIFGPIAFLSGIVGQFFKQFGLTIVFAMAISLFDAMTVAPMLSAAWGTQAHKGGGIFSFILDPFDRFQGWLEEVYERVLKFSVRRPLVVLVSALVIFVASLGLTGVIQKTFLPAQDNGEIEIAIEMPPGTSLQKTSDLTSQIDAVLRQEKAVLLTSAVVGSRNQEPNIAKIYVRLVPSSERKTKTSEFKNAFRQRLDEFRKNAIINVGDYDAIGGGQRPFNLIITGDDLDKLSNYVQKLKTRMIQIPGVVDLDTNYRSGKPEFQIQFDRKRAESLGVATTQAGAELRARVEGIIPAVYREKGEEFNIRLRLDESSRDLAQQFATTYIPNVNFNMIPLAKVATGTEAQGYSMIPRINKSRYIQITSDIGKGGGLGDISDATTKLLEGEFKPEEGMNWQFMGQAQDFKDLIANIIIAITLGVIFIYLVLASLYESFIVPFTILLALPLAVCGAFVALYLAHESINIFSMIGFVMLLGVVTKNSILLVDYTLQLQSQGVERNEALIKAGKTRLRPILMTSFTLIAGTIPIAVGLNEASKQRTAMGIAIIGGLISSTLLTLVVVPAAYGYVDRFRKWLGNF